MESRIQEVMSRIREIQMRIGSFNAPPPPPAANLNTSSGAAGAVTPFDVLHAEKIGQVSLRPTAGLSAGPFSADVEGLITKYAAQNKLSPDLVRAVIQQESSGNPRDVSAAGAQGLMQLMPETAKEYGVTNSFDPEQNIAAGTRHLAKLVQQYNGNIPLALAAYNAGVAAVKKNDGIPPYPETKQYIQRIMGMLGQR